MGRRARSLHQLPPRDATHCHIGTRPASRPDMGLFTDEGVVGRDRPSGRPRRASRISNPLRRPLESKRSGALRDVGDPQCYRGRPQPDREGSVLSICRARWAVAPGGSGEPTGLVTLEVTPTKRHGSIANRNFPRLCVAHTLASSVSCMLSISHSPRATRPTSWIGRMRSSASKPDGWTSWMQSLQRAAICPAHAGRAGRGRADRPVGWSTCGPGPAGRVRRFRCG